MVIKRGFKFKLKTTEEQASLLHSWVGHVRFVWNKALDLNLTRLAQRQPLLWYEELDFWSKQWKRSTEYHFLKEVPAHCLQQKLRDLQRAFRDAFDTTQPNKRLPVFKKRGDGDSIRFPEPKHIRIEGNRIKLPKIGWLRFFKSREIQGAIRNVTITRHAGQWYLSVQTEMTVPDPVHPATTIVALDRGIEVFAALSTGKMYAPLNAFKKQQDKLARLQRRLARKQRFSSNWKKLKKRIARLHHKIAQCRLDFLHKLSTRLSQSHAMIVLEDLQIKNMSRTAKGDLDNPGKHVRQKSGLNRSILDQGWGRFGELLTYKQHWRGGNVLKVPPHYTSQRCPECEYTHAQNRVSRAEFRCQKCHYERHADIVGAINILAAGQAQLAVSSG